MIALQLPKKEERTSSLHEPSAKTIEHPEYSGTATLLSILKTNRMKKLYIVIVVVVLNLSYFSCTPQHLSDEKPSTQACCGDDIPIYPPPPPVVGG